MTARALGKRVADLEAATPMKSGCYCMVVHEGDCEAAKAAAISKFVAEHGHEPDHFVDVVFVATQTKQSICGCPLAHERNQHDKPGNAHRVA